MLPTLPATAAQAEESVLLRRARAGDNGALGALYLAHARPAHALARALAGADDADDLLAEAWARVVAQFRSGRGPADNFHGYLFATIRNRHRDLCRRPVREQPASDHPWLLDGTAAADASAPAAAAPPGGLDPDLARAALLDLPPAWRDVLVQLEVRRRSVPELAAALGITPPAVSSLAYRAREGLRLAYLERCLPPAPVGRTECTWVHHHLARRVRASLGTAATARTDAHVGHCGECRRAHATLTRVNRHFGRGNETGHVADAGRTAS